MLGGAVAAGSVGVVFVVVVGVGVGVVVLSWLSALLLLLVLLSLLLPLRLLLPLLLLLGLGLMAFVCHLRSWRPKQSAQSTTLPGFWTSRRLQQQDHRRQHRCKRSFLPNLGSCHLRLRRTLDLGVERVDSARVMCHAS